MWFLIAIAAVFGLLAWVAVVRFVPPLLLVVATVTLGYALGPEFFKARVAGVPISIDRLLFVTVLAAAGLRWWRQRSMPRLAMVDMPAILLVAVLAVSTVLHWGEPLLSKDAPPMWRLIASYLMPLAIYILCRTQPITERQWRWMLAGMAAFGGYLILTALAEVTQQWWAVFPRYIADPLRGTHFGRARGPTLMAASMGVQLSIMFAACLLLVKWHQTRGWVLAIVATALFGAAIYCTYTRSTWLGTAAATLIVLGMTLPRQLRGALLVSAVCGLCLVAVLKWDSIVGLKRETTASETRHSVSQRASFLYVSWQMFQDRPLLGCGFGRFIDEKLPYLSDRRQQIELGSIRELQHHNTFLSVLVEAGIVGFVLFVGTLINGGAIAWRLAIASHQPTWKRHVGVFGLAVLAAYICSAVFHDLSLSPAEHMVLFMAMGLAAGPATAAAYQPARRAIVLETSAHAGAWAR